MAAAAAVVPDRVVDVEDDASVAGRQPLQTQRGQHVDLALDERAGASAAAEAPGEAARAATGPAGALGRRTSRRSARLRRR